MASNSIAGNGAVKTEGELLQTTTNATITDNS
jgi:hypothetical protein